MSICFSALRRHAVPMVCMLSGSVAAVAQPPAAQTAPGIHFAHHDWEVACDNTRTCRAAGYQTNGEPLSVSLLLTRHAGPNTAVTGEVQLGQPEDGAPDVHPPSRVTLHIDKRVHGDVPVNTQTRTGALQTPQVRALLAALPHRSVIELRSGSQRWRISNQGASAVLLKMDDVQGRIGTPSALIRKGKHPESQVQPALPLPVVPAAPLAPAQRGDAAFVCTHDAALRQALRRLPRTEQDHCPLQLDASDSPLSATRLSADAMLLSGDCWSGAYNMGVGHWVVPAKPPFRAQRVTHSATDFDAGRITAAHKDRGMGDCLHVDEWVWTGKVFVHTTAYTTGLCKGVAAGGAWPLPTLQSQVQPAGAAPLR